MFHSIETEQSLLGGLALESKRIIDLDLTEEDFVGNTHPEIFGEMRRLFGEKQRFDLHDFDAWGTGKPSPAMGDESSMANYIRAIARQAITAVNVLDWATHLKELSRKRRVSDAIAAATEGLADKDSAQVIAELQTALTERLDAKRQRTAEHLLNEIISDMDRPPVFYPTRLKHLDRAMAGGLYAGYTYGLCGKEKAGKTTFAHSISFNLGHSGCKHLYVALEMGAKQIEQRNIARSLGINSLDFINPPDDLKNRVLTAKKTSNIVYLDAPGSALDEILHEIGIARLRHNITGFIIDYWQLVGGQNNRETEEKHMRTVAQSFADYARRHGLWCILLAQMNKEGDLFGGGGLRKACDQLYFIETPDNSRDVRWMRMGASRYTPQVDIGSNTDPRFLLNKRVGPHFTDV